MSRRVAIMLPCFWPEVRRGAERIAWELATGLRASGHSPEILTSHPGATTRSVEQGIPVIRNRRPPEGWLRRRGFLEYLTHTPSAYAKLTSGDFEVAHAMHASDGVVAGRWSRRTGRPSVLAWMGIPDRAGLTDRRLRLECTLEAARACTVVTALSAAAARAFRRWLDVEARVIHPGVDLERFLPGGERTDDPTVYCAAAADDPRKGVPLLIEAFGLLRRDLPAARLVLARPNDDVLAGRLAAVEGVSLADTSDVAVLANYRSAWAVALPSFGEAFGLVLAEALACGTPVVGTDHGAIPEIVDRPEIGRLFARDDAPGLAGALREALELARDRGTAEACRARAGDFSAERTTAAYEALYAELSG